MGSYPRGTDGQFLPRHCPDPNCDGDTVLGKDRFGFDVWHCNGLTHVETYGPLIACERQHDAPNKATTHA